MLSNDSRHSIRWVNKLRIWTCHYPAEIFSTWYLFGQNPGTRFEKMAGSLANRDRIFGASLIVTLLDMGSGAVE